MTGSEDLSFAFLESHPSDAARVLERLAPKNVAHLLSDAPARLVAPVLRAMLPPHVARCLESVADDTVSGLLRAMGPQSGAAVLHYATESRRNALLAQLPTAMGMAFRLLLGYPQDTVGAWMDPRGVAMPADTPVDVALARLREAQGEVDSCVFVIGPQQRLIGLADLVALLRAAPDMPLSKVMRKVPYALPARASMYAVQSHAGWDDSQVLPVVERDARFVGALDRGVLARALQRNRQAEPEGRYGDMAASLAGGYWSGVSGLIQLVVALIPVAPPLTDEEDHERSQSRDDGG